MERGSDVTANLAGNWSRFAFGPRMGFRRNIEVSEEFKTKVIEIASSDEDVKKLLDDGYTVIDVRPIISTRVEADGQVVAKATAAVVTLKKDMTGRAEVWVDIAKSKVARLVITTRRVIDKS